MPIEPRPRNRMLIPVLVAVLGIALGVVGIVLLGPLDPAATAPRASTADKRTAQPSAPLSDAAIRARVEPSVVDITAALTFDDETASGTGFVIDPRAGLILTNNHVIRLATSVTVTVPATGGTYPARIVGVDVTADIAVLQIAPVTGLAGAPLGEGAAVGPGTRVISFGNQAGAGGSPTVAPGVISGTGRTIQAADGASGFTETLHDMLATTARIVPGDSGGPLAGPAGTVIGVDTAAGTGGTNTGYAIPIGTAMAAERQITDGRPGPGVSRGVDGFLGVVVASSTAHAPAVQRAQEEKKENGRITDAARIRTAVCVPTEGDARAPAAIAPAHAGALVEGVLCGTPAAAAGIAAGDVITVADGRPVASADALTGIVSDCRPGTMMSLTWVSTGGTTRTSRVRLGTAPAA